MDNCTSATEFILLGFRDLRFFKGILFLLLLVVYVATICGNLLIIVLVETTHQLQSPMYFFLLHLSLCDIVLSTDVNPNSLQVILLGEHRITKLSCHIQLYIFGGSITTECCLLTVMSYDRYLAVCDPLHYSSIMKHHLPSILVALCWAVSFSLSAVTESFTTLLDFCGPNIIDHFFCDLAPVLKLASSDTTRVEVTVTIIVFIFCFSQLLFVIATYICIFKSILHISSTGGLQKIFSTCSSHLVVSATYFGTLIILYMAPSRGYSLNMNKALSLINSVLTPLFNPAIYSLRNKEIRIALREAFVKLKTCNDM